MLNIIKIVFKIIVINLFITTTAFAEVVVIGHANNSEKMSINQVKRIYLGKEKTFPNGNSVEVIDFVEGSSIRDEFYANVVKKTPQQTKAYHAKLVFSGNGAPPNQLASAAEIKAWVAEKPGRLGYIDSADLDASVKEVLRVN